MSICIPQNFAGFYNRFIDLSNLRNRAQAQFECFDREWLFIHEIFIYRCITNKHMSYI